MDPRLRIDRRESLRSPRVQADGTVIYDAVLSRAGVFKYRNDDGSWRNEYRPSAEVFSEDSMKSFEGMALTDYHPDGKPITIENRTDKGRGYIVPGSLRRDGNELLGSIHVTDANLLAAIKNGRTAISLGYFQDTVIKSGVATEDGLPYDRMQTNMRGNHAAMVDEARAGDSARIRTDSITSYDANQETVMDELKKALAAMVDAQTEANKQKLRADAADAEIVTLKKTLATTEAARDTAVDKLATSEKLRVDGADKVLADARAFVQLESAALKILTVDGEAPSLAKLTARQIQEKVIVKLTGKEIPAGKNDDYISARYDSLTEDLPAREDNDRKAIGEVREGVRKSGAATTNDGTSVVQKAHQKMIDDQNNAWKTKN